MSKVLSLISKVNKKQKGKSPFNFIPFSLKQKKILSWWIKPKYKVINGKKVLKSKGSPYHDRDVMIADGAVRTGKTLIMSLSYVLWAMETYNYQNFGMAGKTIGSFRRNVLFTLKIILKLRGYHVLDRRNENYLVIRKYNKETEEMIENYFYLFGGRDERSQDLVQGFTSAGFFFDEVALMPQSFVNQAVARCSVEGRKLWFNCNPKGPFHWFKLEWIDDVINKNAYRIHFNLEDNPSLSKKMIKAYKTMFKGIFYQRYILGLWVAAEGIIYSMFEMHMIIDKVYPTIKMKKKWIGIDYGQSNATAFLYVALGTDNKVYILDEYYHEGKTSLIQLSPKRYAMEYMKFKKKIGVSGMPINHDQTYVDPSAKGFILQLHEEGERKIKEANNEVLLGIEMISSLIQYDMVRIHSKCINTLKEINSYSWDTKKQERGIDEPKKEHDHAMDAFRYVVNSNRLLFQRLLIDKQKEVERKLPVAN